MSCERHGKGTRSPAGARAAGSDCVASDAPGGGQGDREHAQTRLEGSRAEEGRLGWPAAGRGARARAIEGEAAGGGGGGDSGGDGGDDGGGSGGGGGRGGGGAAAAPSGPKIVHPDMRTSRCPGALRGARAHFEMPGQREGAPYQQKAMNRTPLM